MSMGLWHRRRNFVVVFLTAALFLHILWNVIESASYADICNIIMILFYLTLKTVEESAGFFCFFLKQCVLLKVWLCLVNILNSQVIVSNTVCGVSPKGTLFYYASCTVSAAEGGCAVVTCTEFIAEWCLW